MTFPFVDLDTNKIYNCLEGSRAWWHEQGHIKFSELESTGKWQLYQHYALLLWMLSITLSILNKYMLFLAIPLVMVYLGIEVYEEVWCNRYANEMLEKKKYINY